MELTLQQMRASKLSRSLEGAVENSAHSSDVGLVFHSLSLSPRLSPEKCSRASHRRPYCPSLQAVVHVSMHSQLCVVFVIITV